MKNKSVITITMLTFAIGALIISCSGKKHGHDEGKKDWPEMNAFHMTMAEAYHPFKDSANTDPAKKLAGNLANEADVWAASSIPEGLSESAVKPKLDKLKITAHAFADHIKSGATNEEIGKELTEFHQDFHELMEAGDGEKKHQH